MVREKCSVCGAESPPVESDFTLLGGALGWRVARKKGEAGGVQVEWFCAECWKKRRGTALPPSR